MFEHQHQQAQAPESAEKPQRGISWSEFGLKLWLGNYAPSKEPKRLSTTPSDKFWNVVDGLGAVTFAAVPLRLAKKELADAVARCARDPARAWAVLGEFRQLYNSAIEKIFESGFLSLGGKNIEFEKAKKLVERINADPPVFYALQQLNASTNSGAQRNVIVKDFIRFVESWKEMTRSPLDRQRVLEEVGRYRADENLQRLKTVGANADTRRQLEETREFARIVFDQFGFTYLSPEALTRIKGLMLDGKVVDAGSGTRLFGSVLEQTGLQVRSIDNDTQAYIFLNGTFGPVINGDGRAVKEALNGGFRTILNAYPTPNSTLPYESLNLLRDGHADRMILIPGEFFASKSDYIPRIGSNLPVENLLKFWNAFSELRSTHTLQTVVPRNSTAIGNTLGYPILIISR